MVVEPIGDGDVTVIDEIVVEYVTDHFESVAVSETSSPSVCDATSDGTSSRPAPREETESAPERISRQIL
jgi:hypothetical protein